MTGASSTFRGVLRLAAAAVLALAATACGDGGSGPSDGPSGEPEAETISRETFVATYVDLRLAALRRNRETITEEEREEVLERHGVDEDDLLRFVEVHGERADFMQELWEEVDERIRRRSGGESSTRPEPAPSADQRTDQRTVGRTTPMLRAS